MSRAGSRDDRANPAAAPGHHAAIRPWSQRAQIFRHIAKLLQYDRAELVFRASDCEAATAAKWPPFMRGRSRGNLRRGRCVLLSHERPIDAVVNAEHGNIEGRQC